MISGYTMLKLAAELGKNKTEYINPPSMPLPEPEKAVV